MRRNRKKYSDLTAELWFDAGIHPVERLINLEGHPQSDDLNDIDSSLSNRFMKAIDWLEGEDKDKQIIVKINSLGGMEYDMFAIYDRIKDCNCYITIITYGACMSAASVILQAGDKRLMTPNSQLMIHSGTINLDYANIEDADANVKHARQMNNVMYKIYQDKMKKKTPKITTRRIRELCKVDKYMTAEETVRLGLADGIYDIDYKP